MPVGRDTFRMVATQNNMLQHGPPTSLVATNNSILPEADLEDRHFCPRFSIVFPVAWSSAVLRPILSVLSSGFCRSPYPSLGPLHAPAKVFQPCKRWDNSLEWRGKSVRTWRKQSCWAAAHTCLPCSLFFGPLLCIALCERPAIIPVMAIDQL